MVYQKASKQARDMIQETDLACSLSSFKEHPDSPFCFIPGASPWKLRIGHKSWAGTKSSCRNHTRQGHFHSCSSFATAFAANACHKS